MRGALLAVLQSINDAARILDVGAECIGGGSGRSLSFTALVVRKSGQSSNPQHLSALVLGVGEVKGAWQLDLQSGDKLEDMLRDPARIEPCVMALQQASHTDLDAVTSSDVGQLLCTCLICAHSDSTRTWSARVIAVPTWRLEKAWHGGAWYNFAHLHLILGTISLLWPSCSHFTSACLLTGVWRCSH